MGGHFAADSIETLLSLPSRSRTRKNDVYAGGQEAAQCCSALGNERSAQAPSELC